MAFKGNGSSQYILSSIFTPPVEWTFHFLYKGIATPDNHNSQFPLNLSNGSTYDLGFTWNHGTNAKSVYVVANDTVYRYAVISTALSGGVWYAIGGRFTGAFSISSWLDGVVENTTAGAVMTTGTTPALSLLAGIGGTIAFDDGHIAEVGFWNVALSDAEMLALGSRVCPLMIRPSSLLCYGPLIGNTNAKLGNTLTNHSTTQTEHPRVIYPDLGDVRRITALSAGVGSETRNVDFASSFFGGVPGVGAFMDTVDFESDFESQNIIARSVNFASSFAVPLRRVSLENDARFTSRFKGTTGALANGRFRGRFYG